jgi:heat shock protein HslJ
MVLPVNKDLILAIRPVAVIATIVLSLGSMGMQQPPVQLPPVTSPVGQTAQFPGGAWQWQSTQHADGSSVVAADPSRYTVTFQPDGRLTIRADCNTVLGSYTVSGAALQIQLGPSTLVGCPPDSQADQFTADLARVTGYALAGENLQLKLGSTGDQMLLSPLAMPELVGTNWEANSYNNGRGGVQSLLAGTEMTAVFGDNGQVSGSSGCNRYFGPYQSSGESLQIGPLASSRMLCQPAEVMDQEQAFLAALERTTQYQFENGNLVLRDAGGATQAIFHPAAS